MKSRNDLSPNRTHKTFVFLCATFCSIICSEFTIIISQKVKGRNILKKVKIPDRKDNFLKRKDNFSLSLEDRFYRK